MQFPAVVFSILFKYIQNSNPNVESNVKAI